MLVCLSSSAHRGRGSGLDRRASARNYGARIVVCVIADSPGAATDRAERAVSRALAELDRDATVSARIISTDGEEPEQRSR
jgi:hypothetical protein